MCERVQPALECGGLTPLSRNRREPGRWVVKVEGKINRVGTPSVCAADEGVLRPRSLAYRGLRACPTEG